MTRNDIILAIRKINPNYIKYNFSGTPETELQKIYHNLMLTKKLRKQSRRMSREVKKMKRKK